MALTAPSGFFATPAQASLCAPQAERKVQEDAQACYPAPFSRLGLNSEAGYTD
ncbi:TPA: hypothetical protein ACIAIE_003851 [Serratia fonticola]